MAIKFLNTVQVDTDVLYVDAANDRVGIGTNTPSIYHILDVNGDANFSNDISVGRNATALSFDMNPGYDSGNYYLKLYKNQTDDGGILLVSKPTTGSAQIDWQISNQGTTADLKFYAYGLGGNAFVLDRETGKLKLPEYGAGTLVSDASGNITVSSGGGAGGPYLPLTAGSSYPLTGALNINNTLPTIKLTDTDTSAYGRIKGSNGSLTLEADEGNTQADSFIKFEIDTDERMRIDSDGNVGIGTTSPSATLHLSGISQTGTKTAFRIDNDSGNNKFFVNSVSGDYNLQFKNAGNTTRIFLNSNGDSYLTGGNVGIGTTSPDTKLHVEGNVLIDAYNQGEDNGLFFREGFLTIDQPSITVWDMSNSGASPDGLSINSQDGIRFRENGGEVARFKDGSFGIGTTSPNKLLDVSSDNTPTIRITNTLQSSSNYTAGVFEFYSEDASTPGGARVLSSILCVNNAGSAVPNGNLAFYTALGGGSGAAATEKMRIASNGAIQFNDYGAGTLVTDASGNITVSSGGGAGGPYLPLAGGTMTGTITMNNNRITSIEELRFNNGGNIGNQINTDVDTGTETVANVEIATYTAAFFDFVVKKTTNVRSGTVYACHDGTNVEYTETSTNDLGDTSDVTLSVDISGTNMRLLATVTSDDWSVKSLIRAI